MGKSETSRFHLWLARSQTISIDRCLTVCELCLTISAIVSYGWRDGVLPFVNDVLPFVNGALPFVNGVLPFVEMVSYYF